MGIRKIAKNKAISADGVSDIIFKQKAWDKI